MNVLVFSMLISAGVAGVIASRKGRSPALWMSLGLCTGPVAVTMILLLSRRNDGKPSKQPIPLSPVAMPSIADDIDGLAGMRARRTINDDEFAQGKVQILAWPVSSPILSAPASQRACVDGRRTWALYQPATRASLETFALRHALHPSWRSDVPFEVACTFRVQPGLSFELSLALEKGMIHCWGTGWDLNSIDLLGPEQGLPRQLEAALDALVCGTGRIVILQALRATSPFLVTLQTKKNGRWQTVRRRWDIPVSPVWRRTIVANTDARPA